MNDEKFDTRLRERIEESLRQRFDAGMHLAEARDEVSEERIPVTITHAESLKVKAAPAKDEKAREEALNDLRRGFADVQGKPMEVLEKEGVQGRELLLSNSIAAELTIEQLQKMQELDEVAEIRLVKKDKVTCLNQSARVIGAPETWSVQRQTGNGVRVAVLDSGIDGDHPALHGKVVDGDSMVPGEGVNVPGDHGTHVAGIIASQHSTRRGIAYEADLINIKVLDAIGNGDHTWVEQGMQRAYELGAEVVNMSLGWSHIYHSWDCPGGHCSLCRAAKSLVDLGVVVVVAAGNEGNERMPPPPDGDTNLRCPGQCRDVITVGGVQKDLAMYTNSSLGPPSYWDGWTVGFHFASCITFNFPFPGEPWVTKPDLCAPGVGINSTVLNNGWATYNGTSMASPHVAGVAALMLQKNGGMPPQTVKNILIHTAYGLPFDRFTCGAGLVDAYSAVLHS